MKAEEVEDGKVMDHVKYPKNSRTKDQEPGQTSTHTSGAFKEEYRGLGYLQQVDRLKWPILLSPPEVCFPSPTTHIEQILQDTVRDPIAEMKHHPNWLLEGITIRVSRGPFYGFVGTVLEIEGHGVWAIATIKMDYDERGRFAISDLSTVVPAQGSYVMIVQGRHRGSPAKLLERDEDGFMGTLRITGGLFKGVVLLNVPFSFFTSVGKLSGDSAAEPL